MLVIRLSRTGSKNKPAYSIIVTEKSNAAKTGRVVEKIGHFVPHGKSEVFVCDQERVRHWILKGAKPSETLARKLDKEGMKGMDEYFEKGRKYSRKSKKEQPEEVKNEKQEVKSEEGTATESAPAEATATDAEPAEASESTDEPTVAEEPEPEPEEVQSETEAEPEPEEKSEKQESKENSP